MRTHTGERPYQCSHCDKAYVKSDSLIYHIGGHSEEQKDQENSYADDLEPKVQVKEEQIDIKTVYSDYPCELKEEKMDISAAVA